MGKTPDRKKDGAWLDRAGVAPESIVVKDIRKFTAGSFFGVFIFGNVDEHIYRAHNFSRGITNWIRIWQHVTPGSIGAFDDDFFPPDCPAFFKVTAIGHWSTGSGVPVRTKNPIGAAP